MQPPSTTLALVQVERVGATLGAVVTGLRLATLEDREWLEVEQAFHEHAVLIFPAQHLTADEQKAFARRFGALETQLGPDGTVPITNATKEGRILEPDNPVLDVLRGNEGWHTDSSYMPVAAKASMLSAHVVPAKGGATEWADMRAAYDAVDPALQAKVGGLNAYHSIVYSQLRAGEKLVEGAYGYD